MEFNLTKDICFFDLEATGLNVIRDRIMQIGIIKHFKNGKEPEQLDMLINPGIPIGLEALGVHGITPKDVANKPTFAQVAEKLHAFIGNADLAGYNISRFDVPLLMEEFARAGIDFSVEKRNIVDMQRIFYKMEPRTLGAALKFYCGKKMENAHNALADVEATIDVFKGQLKMYADIDYEDKDGIIISAPVKNDMKAIHDFTQDPKAIDVTNRLKYNDIGEIVFNFGKYTGQPVKKVIMKDKQYYHWILNKEFSVQVKNIVKDLMKEAEKGN
jgi:DNA polymerase-3 subunit epsilon